MTPVAPDHNPQTLLFPTYNYPPVGRGGALMRYHMTRLLADLGWDVHVLTTGASQGVLIRQVEDTSLPGGNQPGITVHRRTPWNLGVLPELLYLSGWWICPHTNWYRCWEKHLDNLPPAAGVLASFPPTANLLLGEALADHHELPLFLDFRDEFAGARSTDKGQRWQRKAAATEERLCRRAAHIFVTSRTVALNLQSRYGLSLDRVTVVENGIFAPQQEADSVAALRSGRPATPVRLVWLGTMSQHQRPETLIEGFRCWQSRHPEKKQQVVLQIVCHASLYFRHRIQPCLGDGIEWRSFVPRAEIPELAAGSDLGCLSLGGDLYGYALPTKLYDYVHFQLPMLAVLPQGEARALIERKKLGRVVSPGDVNGVADVLEQLLDESVRTTIRDNMRDCREELLFEGQVAAMDPVLKSLLRVAGSVE